MRRTAFKRYVTGFALLVGAGLGLLVGVNALVNPFNLFAGPRIAGLNDYKYELVEHSHMAKAAEVRRLRPECLILGSSRAQVGLDPGHPGWGACRAAYNLALSGGNLYEAMRYFQHAAAVQKPKRAVLALDLLMFNTYKGPWPGFDEERLLTSADGLPNAQWRRATRDDLWASLISWGALRASWMTVFPGHKHCSTGPEDGYWEYTCFDPGYIARHGQREVFRRNEEGFLTKNWFPPPQRRFDTRDPRTGAETYDYLRTILRLAHRDGVQFSMLISPAHARQWEALRQAGLWGQFEEWKRTLVRVNAEEARRAGQTPFPLWDFSGYNRYTNEEVPADGDRTSRMRWYWESSHYRKELGDRVLDRVLGYRSNEREALHDFGARLDASTIDAQLAATRAAAQRWRQSHAPDIAEIAEIARKTAAWRRP